jgi:hypothetical protein
LDLQFENFLHFFAVNTVRVNKEKNVMKLLLTTTPGILNLKKYTAPKKLRILLFVNNKG